MAHARAQSVTDYLAVLPQPARRTLTEVRRIIRRAIPKADEGISYGIPVYRLQGRVVIYFAAWRQHFSLYPSGGRLVRAFRDKLAGYEVRKGTIRFPLDAPVPARLIGAIARFRAKDVTERSRSRSVRKHS